MWCKSRKNKTKLNLLTIAAMAILSFASCSIFDDDVEEPKDTIDNISISLNVALVSNTRSYTTDDESVPSSGGQQAGQTNENAVTSAVLYFYDAEDADQESYVTQFTARQLTNSGGVYTVKTEVKPEELQVLAGKKLNLYIIANSTMHDFPDNSYDPASGILKMGETVDNPPLGNFGKDGKGLSVPMTNYDVYRVDLTGLEKGSTPDEFLDNLNRFLNGSKTLDFSKQKADKNDAVVNGTLLLERCVARIDYKPGKGEKISTDNVYQIGENTNLYGKIISLQVFNVGKTSYLFRHTAAGSMSAAGNQIDIFGFEKDNKETEQNYRWAADNDWDKKSEWSAEGYTGSLPSRNYFLNQPEPVNYINSSEEEKTIDALYTIPASSGNLHGYTTIEDLTKDNTKIEDYFPWLYISENILPNTDAMIKGLSSGIAFKVMLCNSMGDYLKDFSESGFTLSQIENSGYYKFTHGNKEVVAEAVVDNGTLQGYALTYWYFIPHNLPEDFKPGNETGPMQYGVVRNNIYRVSVTSLNDLPTPYDPHDPDNPGKETPALGVELNVIPWVVRNVSMSW